MALRLGVAPTRRGSCPPLRLSTLLFEGEGHDRPVALVAFPPHLSDDIDDQGRRGRTPLQVLVGYTSPKTAEEAVNLPVRLVLPPSLADESIVSMEANDTGDKLLLASERGCWIVELSKVELFRELSRVERLRAGSGSVESLCASQVGSSLFGEHLPLRRALWHPSAPEHVVSVTDRALHLFDVTTSLVVPELSVRLPQGLDGRARQVASVAIGTPRSAFEAFTAFVLLDSGSVFALCPIVPKGSVWHEAVLDACKEDLSAMDLPPSHSVPILTWLQDAFEYHDEFLATDRSLPAPPADGKASPWFVAKGTSQSLPSGCQVRAQGPILSGWHHLSHARATDLAVLPCSAAPVTSLLLAGVDDSEACTLVSGLFTLEPMLPCWVESPESLTRPPPRPLPFFKASHSEEDDCWETVPCWTVAAPSEVTSASSVQAGPSAAAGVCARAVHKPAAVRALAGASISFVSSSCGDRALVAWGGGAAVLPVTWPQALQLALDKGKDPFVSRVFSHPFGYIRDAQPLCADLPEACHVLSARVIPESSAVASSSGILTRALWSVGPRSNRSGPSWTHAVCSMAMASADLRDPDAAPGDSPALSFADGPLASALQQLQSVRHDHGTKELSSLGGGHLARAMVEAQGSVWDASCPLTVSQVLTLFPDATDKKQEHVLASGRALAAKRGLPKQVAQVFVMLSAFLDKARALSVGRRVLQHRMARLVEEVCALDEQAALLHAFFDDTLKTLDPERGLLRELEECLDVALTQQKRAEKLYRDSSLVAPMTEEEELLRLRLESTEKDTRGLVATVRRLMGQVDQDSVARITSSLGKMSLSGQAPLTEAASAARAILRASAAKSPGSGSSFSKQSFVFGKQSFLSSLKPSASPSPAKPSAAPVRKADADKCTHDMEALQAELKAAFEAVEALEDSLSTMSIQARLHPPKVPQLSQVASALLSPSSSARKLAASLGGTPQRSARKRQTPLKSTPMSESQPLFARSAIRSLFDSMDAISVSERSPASQAAPPALVTPTANLPRPTVTPRTSSILDPPSFRQFEDDQD
jgi:hypothetical protein